jgi:DNA-binding beta-propeller fold protein YncE
MNLHRICGVAAFVVSFAIAEAQAPLAPERVIPLPGVHGRIDHMAFDREHNRIYVAALGTDALVVVDIQSGAVIHTITGLAEPQGIGVDPDHNRLWVANGHDGSVRIYDSQTYQLLNKISLGDDADNIRRDPATGEMLVGYGDGGIAIFDTDGKKRADIKVGGHPESFQMDEKNPRIFVNVPGSHKIAVLDRSKGQVIASWSTGAAFSNFPMALNAVEGRLFVVCRIPAVLLVLDTDSGHVVQKVPTVGDSDDVFYDPALKRVYVSGGGGAISVYQEQERDHYSQMAQIKTSSGARTSLFVPSLNRLFVAVREQGGKPAALQIFTTGK